MEIKLQWFCFSGRLKASHARIAILNDYFKVYVSAIESPEKFWIQNVTEDAKLLDHLIEEMTSYYDEKCQGYQLTEPAVGDLCCAMFKHDTSWYRAKIIQINKEEVHLHYVDFGDKDIVPLSYVKKMRFVFNYLNLIAFNAFFQKYVCVGMNTWTCHFKQSK